MSRRNIPNHAIPTGKPAEPVFDVPQFGRTDMRRCESPDACKWPRCGCIEGLGAIQNAAGKVLTEIRRLRAGPILSAGRYEHGWDHALARIEKMFTSAAPKREVDEKYPHYQAAFINAIAEEGTKDEAVQYLQETWNERCFLAMRLAELEKEVARLRLPLRLDEVYPECMMDLIEAEQRLRKLENALKHQRLALAIVRERQREGDKCHVSVTDIDQGIKQIDAALTKEK